VKLCNQYIFRKRRSINHTHNSQCIIIEEKQDTFAMQDSYVSYPIFRKLSLMYSSSLWNSKLSLCIIRCCHWNCCYMCVSYRWYLHWY